MISLPEGPWQSRCHGLFLLFVIEVMFFEREKMFFFSGGNLRFIKGMSMLFSQSEQTNKQEQTNMKHQD